MRRKISDQELVDALQLLPGWQIQEGKLHKNYIFKSFEEAMQWIQSVATEITKLNHHPEWCNVYNEVSVNLVTHHLGNAVSSADIELAEAMERLISQMNS